jgi:hypothetical protein
VVRRASTWGLVNVLCAKSPSLAIIGSRRSNAEIRPSGCAVRSAPNSSTPKGCRASVAWQFWVRFARLRGPANQIYVTIGPENPFCTLFPALGLNPGCVEFTFMPRFFAAWGADSIWCARHNLQKCQRGAAGRASFGPDGEDLTLR